MYTSHSVNPTKLQFFNRRSAFEDVARPITVSFSRLLVQGGGKSFKGSRKGREQTLKIARKTQLLVAVNDRSSVFRIALE